MITKGTMIPVKKGLGALLLIAGGALVLSIEKMITCLCDYKIVFGIVLLASAYFLLVSGRRN